MSSDQDTQSIEQANKLVEQCVEAQKTLASFSQEKIDRIVGAMARAALEDALRLGELASKETGYGIPADKAVKNRFAAENVFSFIKPLRTVGVIRESDNIVEVASPKGVVAAVIPSTNPTSTAIFKILIAIKAGDAIVLSPHPSAINCILETSMVMSAAGESEGLPAGAIGCLSLATIEGTQALMKHKRTAVVLATGGIGLVRAAYSSGKPAFGVGPGNVPAMIERSADMSKAVKDILTGKCFDNGTICSSEQAIIVERSADSQVRELLQSEAAIFLNKDQQERLTKVVTTDQGSLNAKIVGKSAAVIADMAGLTIPAGTRAMVCELEGVGRDFPLSIEKLSPILAYYVVDNLEEGCNRCAQILRFGGMGHTASIHTQSRDAAREYGIRMPASRIIVNSPSTHGAIGFTTDLEPSMTLGCGSWGGNVTSDNISPRHLMDVKRIAFETRPVNQARPVRTASAGASPAKAGIDRDAIAAMVDRFLAGRSVKTPAPPPAPVPARVPPVPPPPTVQTPSESANKASNGQVNRVYDFVCEEDVKRAITGREIIYINSKTIITPAARDLGEAKGVFSKI